MAQFSCSANGAIKLPRQTFTNHKTGGQKAHTIHKMSPGRGGRRKGIAQDRQLNSCLRFALFTTVAAKIYNIYVYYKTLTSSMQTFSRACSRSDISLTMQDIEIGQL